jgi:hypothetical protein
MRELTTSSKNIIDDIDDKNFISKAKFFVMVGSEEKITEFYHVIKKYPEKYEQLKWAFDRRNIKD